MVFALIYSISVGEMDTRHAVLLLALAATIQVISDASKYKIFENKTNNGYDWLNNHTKIAEVKTVGYKISFCLAKKHSQLPF